MQQGKETDKQCQCLLVTPSTVGGKIREDIPKTESQTAASQEDHQAYRDNAQREARFGIMECSILLSMD